MLNIRIKKDASLLGDGWLATNLDSSTYWHKSKPEKFNQRWKSFDNSSFLGLAEYGTCWENSLIEIKGDI